MPVTLNVNALPTFPLAVLTLVMVGALGEMLMFSVFRARAVGIGGADHYRHRTAHGHHRVPVIAPVMVLMINPVGRPVAL